MCPLSQTYVGDVPITTIHARAAKAIGLTIRALARADEVIA